MILQQNLESQLDNIINILAYKYGKELSEINSLISLKRLYNRYTSEMHNIDFTDPTTKIVTEKKRSKKLLSIFNGDVVSSLDDRDQVNLINNNIINIDLEKEYSLINNALAQIKKTSEEYFILLNLIINKIFIFPAEGARGGSSSTGVGLIWANPKFDTPLNDTVEFMIHELTHNCMFIDEIRYGHYHYNEIIKEESWAKSAILKTNRPLDKVIHSIVVSLEIILFREKFIGHPDQPKLHPPTPIMIEQINESILSVEKVVSHYGRPIISERVFSILDNVKRNVKNYV